MITMGNLSYEPITGVFYKEFSYGLKEVGSKYQNKCGAVYVNIYHNNKSYLAHRLAWLMFYGEEPYSDIDHFDGDGSNNKISNLRCVTKSKNQRNQKLSSRNKSGVAGVLWRGERSKYDISATVKGKLIYLGSTKDLFEAACIRKSFNNKNGFTERHG